MVESEIPTEGKCHEHGHAAAAGHAATWRIELVRGRSLTGSIRFKEHSGVPADRFDFSHCVKLVSNACGFSLSVFAAHPDIQCMLNDVHFLHSPNTFGAVLLCLDCCLTEILTDQVQSKCHPQAVAEQGGLIQQR